MNVLRNRRKVLCSIGAGAHEELLALSGQTFKIYAERHGYDLVLETSLLEPQRPAAWSKVRLLQQMLQRYDTVFWVDSDAAIVDVSRDIADEVGRKYLGLIAHRYEGQVIPNTGVLLLNRGRRAEQLLEATWDATQWIDHPWWENAAILDLMGHEVGDGPGPVVLTQPTAYYRKARFLGNEWNSIMVDEAAHPRIRHYPGRSQEFRLEHLVRDVQEMQTKLGLR